MGGRWDAMEEDERRVVQKPDEEATEGSWVEEGKGAVVEVEGGEMRDDASGSLQVSKDMYDDGKSGRSFGGEEGDKEWKSVFCLFIATAPHCFQKSMAMAKNLLLGEYGYGRPALRVFAVAKQASERTWL